MKIKYIITGLALAAALTVVACESVPPQQVIVAKADLKENVITAPGPQQQAAPIIIEAVPSEKIREALKKNFPGETTVYVTQIDFVKPKKIVDDNPATPENEALIDSYQPVIVPITPPATEEGKPDFGTWIEQALPAIATILPAGAGPWVPLAGYLIGLLGFKRSRKHLGNAAKALNPFDGASINLGEATGSLKKALGWEHSIATPAELRAIADKLEAEEQAKAKFQDAVNK